MERMKLFREKFSRSFRRKKDKEKVMLVNCVLKSAEGAMDYLALIKEQLDKIMSSAILEPEVAIRAVVDQNSIQLLAERLFGISVLSGTEIHGYDDRNFLIQEDKNIKNPLITKHCSEGYILKIMNALDSQKLTFVESQSEVLNFLNNHSIVCPKPIRNIFGHYYSLENISGKQHAIMLFENISGVTLKELPIKKEFHYYQVGEFVAHLDVSLKGFTHSGLLGHQNIWMLEKVPELEKFKSVITDTAKLELVEEVIEEFKYAVLPRLAELERGVIHGDVSPYNLLATKRGDGDFRLTGIRDFGDLQNSYYLFELAITMASMILLSGDPKTGGLVLAGYTVNRRFPGDEYRLLKTCISARIVQCLVLGAHTHKHHPDNEFVLDAEKSKGWELLKLIRTPHTADDLEDITDWKGIADQYLTRS